MKHFFEKNFKIFGAGGPKPPKPPPPPTLKPPKLGDLQAISSYEYVESIDLISDGVIDGFVNQAGEYVDDLQIFESVYLNDAPIRQVSNVDSNSIKHTFDLTPVVDAVSGLFYPSGFSSGFADISITGITGISGVTADGIVFSFLPTRNVIASDIRSEITAIPEQEAVNEPFSTQFSNLKAKFNYANNVGIVKNYLMPSLPSLSEDQYPYFALKLDFNCALYTGLDFSYTSDTFLKFNSDISNYASIPLEFNSLQNFRNVEAPKKINLSYFNSQQVINGSDELSQSIVSGAAYMFLSFDTNTQLIYKNSADALINYLSGIDIVTPNSKFNYGNASVEIRNGAENQKPLSLFSKTYIDQQYNQPLRGPYRKQFAVSSVPRSGTSFNYVRSEFNDAPGTLAASGLITENAIFNLSNYEAIVNAHTALFANASKAIKTRSDAIIQGRDKIRIDAIDFSDNGEYFNITAYHRGEASTRISVQFQSKSDANSVSYFAQKIKIAADNYNLFNPSSDSVTIDSLSKINWSGLGYKWVFTNVEGLAAFLRAIIEQIKNGDGSEDVRQAGGKISFSDWNKQYVASVDEKEVPVVHVINNPNVNQVYVTIEVRVLRDTAEKKLTLIKKNPKPKGKDLKTTIEPGNPFPSVVKFLIETGYQDKFGNEEIFWSEGFQIKGYVDQSAVIDIGREENANVGGDGKSYISKYSRFILGTKNIASPILLPEPMVGQVRFVRVKRLTAESYSSLIKREIALSKVTEIINVPFSYPFSAVCGLKLDARTLNQIPSRSYDARFKKVFVPSNYFPLTPNGKDKRYIDLTELAAFNALPSDSLDRLIYQGNWDGTFKLAWTDNPAWILFDLLINSRYGLGNFISPDQVNYWELYKIARFCDAVDSDGKFVGVPAADGGLEPRYGFNGVIADKTNVFDSLKSIVACFRGNMFYSNSEINFTNDRLKPIMAFFSNANVKDGFFNYSNDRRDLKYNVVEVSFFDRDDLYKEKIEYVEDSDDIKIRGILRTSAKTFGVTSRAHAKRIGQHILYSTINEDQNVSFIASNEILLCRPGDLISVNDEVKTLKRHAGRIIDVDAVNYTLTTNISLEQADFSSSGLSPQISVFIPTGKLQPSDFYSLAKNGTGLNIADLYQTDVPAIVNFLASGTGLIDSAPELRVDYGSKFYIDQTTNSGLPLFDQIQVGAPCSIAIADIKQDVYKIQSIKEVNLNEYEIVASQFDTGKFLEIEASETLDDFFQFFSSDRKTTVNEGFGYNAYDVNKYQITGLVEFQSFTTGEYVGSPLFSDWSGSWNPVPNANYYKVTLFKDATKAYSSYTTDSFIIITGGLGIRQPRPENQYTLEVTPINTGYNPNLVGITQSTGLYIKSTKVKSRGIVRRLRIKK